MIILSQYYRHYSLIFTSFPGASAFKSTILCHITTTKSLSQEAKIELSNTIT
jgi:hypothetical protein